MGVYIRGMEMPTEGGTICVYKISGKFFAARAGKDELFPIIPIPEPHGRLGDLDALPWYLANTSVKYATYEDWEMLCDAIATAPTIIPASKEGET